MNISLNLDTVIMHIDQSNTLIHLQGNLDHQAEVGWNLNVNGLDQSKVRAKCEVKM